MESSARSDVGREAASGLNVAETGHLSPQRLMSKDSLPIVGRWATDECLMCARESSANRVVKKKGTAHPSEDDTIKSILRQR